MFKSSLVLFFSFVMMLGMVTVVSAASVFDITFPIPELGNCADKSACKAYCDELSHANVCAAFAKDYGLGDARTTQQASVLPPTGPGGCSSTSACKSYCDDTSHFDECIQFAEDHGMLSKKEIKQTREGIKKGPGGCNSIQECKRYCSDDLHHLECANYAHDQGQISDSDYQAIKDVGQKGGPGGCKDNDSCHAYCQEADHLDECLSFSQDHGFISKDDALAIRKAGFGGAGPGGCKGNDACRAYCEEPEHQNECIDFAEAKGFMSKEEVVRARKFAGKTGPGGCRGQECRTFCENPTNTETCLEHAEKEGLLPKEEIERAHKFLKTAREGGGPGGCKNATECRAYCQDQTHQQECFEFGKKQGLIRPEEEKQFKAGEDIRKKVEQSGGPGGCKGDDECRIYCTDPSHTEECIAFAAAHGGIDADQARQMLSEFTTGKFSEGHGNSFEDFQRGHEDAAMRFNEFKQLEEQFRGGRGDEGRGFGHSGDRRFDSPPGKFPEQQPGQGRGLGVNFGAGQQNFVGPGGCTGPAECIKYCSEHKEECFNGGPQHDDDSRRDAGSREENNEDDGRDDNQPRDFSQFGRPQFGRPQFGQGSEGESQEHFMPQLRGNIVHEFKSEELPQGFEQRTTEQKQQFFREKFQQSKGEEGTFPGAPSQGFPGGGNMRGQRPNEQQNGNTEGNKGGFDSFNGVGPKSGTQGIFDPIQGGQQRSSDSQRKFQGPSEGQQQLFNQQGNQPRSFGGQEGRDFQNGDANSRGPNGQQMPPAGGFHPPQSGQFPPTSDSGAFKPPQSGQFQPPSGGFPQPSSGGDRFQPIEGGSPGNFPPPPNSGSFPQPPPSSGSFGSAPPPSGGTGEFQPPPSGGTFQPPPSESFGSTPPPSGSTGGFPPPPPQPINKAPQYNFLASILNLLLGNY